MLKKHESVGCFYEALKMFLSSSSRISVIGVRVRTLFNVVGVLIWYIGYLVCFNSVFRANPAIFSG